jgi:gamma-glutamylcyclotransferase (GGCT)/AIG2-like uncharacterized protein YtfP
MKLYLAYGANTNKPHMDVRCPDAKYVCNVTLHHHRLAFRGVADVVPQRGARVVCALWLISPQDEAALDRFEGFPYSYVKRYVTMNLNGRRHRAMFYVMRNRRYESEPSVGYEQCLREGYAQCGMPIGQIDAAIKRAVAWRAKHAAEQHNPSRQWADTVEGEVPPLDAELDEAAAEQFMFEWYSQQQPEVSND